MSTEIRGPEAAGWSNGGVESSQPSIFRRLLAVVALLLVAVLAVRLAVGFVAGLISAVLWIGVVVALVAAVLWARSTLKRGRRERTIEQPPARQVTAATHEDRVAVEMERIREEMRRQGR
jgi:uncharacterized membrane protein YciS (DUF1049 family)